jgi:MSHA biogenesis protein MshI
LQWFFKRRRHAGGRLGVYLSPNGVAVARRVDGAEEPVLDVLAVGDCADPSQWQAQLTRLVREHKLSGHSCVCVLHPSHYQMTQIEAPEVPAAEVRAAVRWRLKEFLSYRVEDAVIDAFELPQAKGRAGPRMMYAVAAPARTVQSLAAAVEGSGLELTAIDVPELALRNLAAQIPDQGGGIAIVSLGADSGLITISQDEHLYLARALEFGERQLETSPSGYGDALVLELQRSLDYYESQLAARPASRVLLAPMAGDRDGLLARMNEQMGTTSYAMDLGQLVELRGEASAEQQVLGFYAAGGALRQEAAA